MSAAFAAERTVAAGWRLHPAQHGAGRRGSPAGPGGRGVLARVGARGGGRPRLLVARGPDLPFPTTPPGGHRGRPTPAAPGRVRTRSRTARAPRGVRRGAEGSARGAPRTVGHDGGPLRGRVRDGPPDVPRGPGAQPAPGDGRPLGRGDGRHGPRGLRRPLPVPRPAAPANGVRTPRRPGPAAVGDDDALVRGGASGASRPACGRRSPDPGGPRADTAKPAPRTERVPPS